MAQKVFLVVDKNEFSKQLEDYISKGEKLYEEKVDMPEHISYRWGMYENRRNQYYEESAAQKKFLSKKTAWIEYVLELLKQSFNVPENEYKKDFEDCGVFTVLESIKDLIKENKEEIREKIENLRSLQNRLPLIPSEVSNGEGNNKTIEVKKQSRKVFIIHGHNTDLRQKIELLLYQLSLEPVVLSKEPNKGRTIIEKIEDEVSDVVYAIVLYTACDLGNDKDKVNTMSDLNPRARQNVIFEHGYLCAKLGREHVCAIVENGVEVPGDLDGVVYINANDQWKIDLCKEFEAVGIKIDRSKIK